jgi:hypothetical protein
LDLFLPSYASQLSQVTGRASHLDGSSPLCARPAFRKALVRFTIRGWNWFQCAVDLERNVDVIKVWDSTGRMLADGEFQLEGVGRAATQSELHPSLILFDYKQNRIDMIYLFKEHHWWGDWGLFGKTLVPIS